MRHLKAGKRLGVTSSHRKAMMRNLVTSLLEHGQIKTTVTRAKEMRKLADKMIGLAKRSEATEGGDLHAKRQVMSFLNNKESYRRLFEEWGPAFAQRQGGYTRIYKLGNRLGDNTQMALIQLIGFDKAEEVSVKAPKSEVREEVTEALKETQQEAPAKASTKKAKVEEAVEVTEEAAKAKGEEA